MELNRWHHSSQKDSWTLVVVNKIYGIVVFTTKIIKYIEKVRHLDGFSTFINLLVTKVASLKRYHYQPLSFFRLKQPQKMLFKVKQNCTTTEQDSLYFLKYANLPIISKQELIVWHSAIEHLPNKSYIHQQNTCLPMFEVDQLRTITKAKSKWLKLWTPMPVVSSSLDPETVNSLPQLLTSQQWRTIIKMIRQ